MMIRRGPVSPLTIGIIAVAFIANAYILPRALVNSWGKADPWTSYFYMYGLGGAFFLVGIFVIIKTGSFTPKRGRDSFWFQVLIWGFVVFASVHAIWIYLALNLPYKGE